MPTKNPRINITLEPAMANLLAELAESEHQSMASLTKTLVYEALERREDMALSILAKVRDIKNASTIKHDDAWK